MTVHKLRIDAFETEMARLVSSGHLTPDQAALLTRVLQPVRQSVPWVGEEAVQQTRSAGDFQTIRDEERKIWQEAMRHRFNPIPGFIWTNLYSFFLLDGEEHPIKVTTITGGEKSVPQAGSYLNPELISLEKFFFYFMCLLRRQHRIDEQKISFEDARAQAKLAQPALKRMFYWLLDFFVDRFAGAKIYDLNRKRKQREARLGRGKLGKGKDQGGAMGGKNRG